MNKEKLWSKDFIFVSVINFIITLIYFLLIVIIGVYSVEKYNISTSEAGLVTGIFIIGEIIGRLLIGRYIEIIGRKKTLSIGLLLFTITTFLYLVDFNLIFLIINRLINGVFMGIASTATGTIVTKIIPASRRGEGIGYFSMSITLATAIGPFIGLLMSKYTNHQIIFIFCAILSVIGLVFLSYLCVEELTIYSEEESMGKFKLSNYIELKALPIAFIMLAISIAYASVLSFIN